MTEEPRFTDRTLSAQEIQDLGLLQDVNPERLKAVSYDLSVGEHVFLLGPIDKGGRDDRYLGDDESVQIPAGWVAVVETDERITLPGDVYGRMSSRTLWALRQLSVFGGLIDPGFEGHLWIPIRNSSQRPISITRGEGLASAVFVKLAADVTAGHPAPRRTKADLGVFLDEGIADTLVSFDDVQERIQALEKSIDGVSQDLRRLEPQISASWTLLNAVLFAAVAGLLGSIGVLAVQEAVDIGGVTGWVVVAAALLAFIAFFAWWPRRGR